ncbi:hypothetical protein RZO55_00235 [Clostridium boliviensis]|uniref:Uncharacterized protein n=1 Tax=Clostridium boliviensis TaxID=318465 RepID=A0ABU4GEH3_9CLOT|nr:hypothetical protein [Clostridium boliviensis]MDW2796014.1 hypothetical protein [Clostridium boliviensis]
MKENYRIGVTIALVFVLMFLLSIAGTLRNSKEAKSKETKLSQIKVQDAPAKKREVVETADVLVSLTEADLEYLKGLEGCFKDGDLEGAARLVETNGESFHEFPCMYSEGEMKREITDGTGIVFLKPAVVFYGDFKDGVPEGTACAISVLQLEEGKRYDYSYGTWKNGTMNGSGECGYRYYDGVKEDITVKTSKSGMFQEDIMQGDITYSSTNRQGETAVWKFPVSDGVIVLNDRWIKGTDENGKVIYKLLANGEKDHAYTLSELATGEARWKNLILFTGKKRGGIKQ